MRYLEVFDTIVDIMHHDYAGCDDKKGWDRPELFRSEIEILEINGNLNRRQFEKIVNNYLLDFRDDHVVLRSSNRDSPPQTVGFRVRRYGDVLYVDRVLQETKIKLGDIITHIDGKEINHVVYKKRSLLKANSSEREWWENVLLEAKIITIEQNGLKKTLKLNQYEIPNALPTYVFKKMNHIGYFQFNDFTDLEKMIRLMEKLQSEIESCKQWIIDIRECRGGIDSVYLPLLDQIYPPNPVIQEDGVLHNVTERNYQNRMRIFKEFQSSGGTIIKSFMQQMDENRGKGFVEFDLSGFVEENRIKGSKFPKEVILLTDKYCGSSGEQFVLDARNSSKVTIVGRSTRGVLDYSNQAFESFDDLGYNFYYSTSKSFRVNRGEGIDFKGITPDVYVKWTPEHLERDVDLERAIELLKEM